MLVLNPKHKFYFTGHEFTSNYRVADGFCRILYEED